MDTTSRIPAVTWLTDAPCCPESRTLGALHGPRQDGDAMSLTTRRQLLVGGGLAGIAALAPNAVMAAVSPPRPSVGAVADQATPGIPMSVSWLTEPLPGNFGTPDGPAVWVYGVVILSNDVMQPIQERGVTLVVLDGDGIMTLIDSPSVRIQTPPTP